METLLNLYNLTINRSELLKVYDIFRFTSTVNNPSRENPRFPNGARLVDVSLESSNVLSVAFNWGKEFYVLLKHDSANFRRMNVELSKSKESNTIISTDERDSGFKNVPDYMVAQLLLNSLGTYECDALKFNNITGHFYCFVPQWLLYFKGKSGDIKKIPCIELKFCNDGIFRWSVHTFSSVLLRKEMDFTNKKFEEYPQYIFGRNNTLTRKPMESQEPGFIARQTKNSKTEITFLDISSSEQYSQCKLGVITSVLEKFKSRFSKYVDFQFKSVSETGKIIIEPKLSEKTKLLIHNILNENQICIVDVIGDAESGMFIKDIKEAFASQFDVTPRIVKKPQKDCLNLRIVHNKEYYKGGEDPHDEMFDNCTVQHLTIENFKSVQSAVNTVAKELLIKKDLNNGEISLVDWGKYGFEGTLTFGLRTKINDQNRFFFMNIHPDGKFNIEELKLDLFSSEYYNDCIKIFDTDEFQKVYGIIQKGSDINIIQETDIQTIPNFYDINEQLKRYEKEVATAENKHSVKGVRSKEYKEDLFGACMDVKCFTENGHHYYYSGVSGHNMNSSIQCAVNVREIVPYKESEFFFDKLLSLMGVTFVRNGQLTVVPFPFKYLREYIDGLRLQC